MAFGFRKKAAAAMIPDDDDEEKERLTQRLLNPKIEGKRPLVSFVELSPPQLAAIGITQKMMKLMLLLLVITIVGSALAVPQEIPPYVKQCKLGDPGLVSCIIGALHHLRPYLAQGIPEIEMPSVEPFRMDELSLSLTTGPNGYKVTLRDLDIFGASNFSVKELKLSEGDKPFEAKIAIPELRINARYTSSGVLIILPASGQGNFHSTLSDILATVRGTISSQQRAGRDYLHVDTLTIDLTIKTVRMAVKKVFNNNRIL
ncbi:hypothetical protein L9F63_005982, partial [Diploptera punctata]